MSAVAGVRLGIVLGVVLGAGVLARDGAAVAPSAPTAAQAPDSTPSRCFAADTIADQLLDTLRRMATAATGSFAARRASLRLPLLSTTREVQQVTSGSRCDNAARLADSVWRRGKKGAHDPKRQVYLFSFGDYFVVADRKSSAGRTAAVSSFTPTWIFLATIPL